MSKHTPGPWHPSTSYIETLICADLVQPGASIEANAQLIAAAPEMLEALRRVQKLNLCDADSDNETHSDPCEGCLIESLIARAEGRES
jgi:hypothetical protein